MSQDRAGPFPTLALNTKVEEDFVSPLTAVRGSLEILRDMPDLERSERQRFIELALGGCAHLERSVAQLSATVYAAGQQGVQENTARPSNADYEKYASRLQILDSLNCLEIDFSDFEFSSSNIVNAFYDVIDESVAATGRGWYFLINCRKCRVWPEAWVAFAHRSKKINVTYSLGTARYDAEADSGKAVVEASATDKFHAGLFSSRDAAVRHLEKLKNASAA
jgi:hypothetical protein